jgi:hypothetical protein
MVVLACIHHDIKAIKRSLGLLLVLIRAVVALHAAAFDTVAVVAAAAAVGISAAVGTSGTATA